MERQPIDTDARSRRKQLIVLTVWAAAIAGWIVYTRAADLSAAEAADSLRDVISSGWWGPAIYIVVYVARPVILFPASVLTILGGIAFGPIAGVAYTMIGSNLSTTATYFAAQRLSGDTRPEPPFGKRLLDRLIANPFETTLILRLAAAPFDAVALAAGIVRLRFGPFLVASFLGTVAGTIAFVSFGSSIESLTEGEPSVDANLLLVSIGLTVGGLVVARWLRRSRPDLVTES